MMTKKLFMFVILALLAAGTVAAQYPMPMCQCVGMDYWPVGPEIQTTFNSDQLDGIYTNVFGLLDDICIDIGDLPYSVPNYGWHCKMTEELLPVRADIYAMEFGMDVRLHDFTCCGGVVHPAMEIFNSGVMFVWDDARRVYSANIGGYMYAAEVVGEDLFIHCYGINPETGHNTVFVKWRIVLPLDGPLGVPNRHNTMGVE